MATDETVATFVLLRVGDNAYLLPNDVLEQWRVPDDKHALLDGLGHDADVRGFITPDQVAEMSELISSLLESRSQVQNVTLSMLSAQHAARVRVVQAGTVR